MARESGGGQLPAPDSDSDVALRRLFADHGASVYRMARSVVRDPGLAEDVTQETFIRAWQHHDSFRGEAPIRHWLLRIAHNLAVSTLRTIREESTDPERLSSHAAVHPDHVVEDRLLVDEALGSLDPLSRAVVVLREVERLTYAEISDVLQVPLPTVKTRLFRARGRLRARRKEGSR
jgi:RNA polymerase sigma-70 factor (ECF subfamily)